MKEYTLLFALLLASTHQSIAQQNIGVGTTQPQAKMHIKGTADLTQFMIDANSTQFNQHPLKRSNGNSYGNGPYSIFIKPD
jgi:hypothetical protein